jgi:probable HAF family extracellular repeat protein
LDETGFTTIDVPGAGLTAAHGINDRNQIVGGYIGSSGNLSFLWDAGSFTTIAVPGARETAAVGINNGGQIVGQYLDASGSQYHGFLWDAGSVTTIDVPGAKNTYPRGINDLGQIVGAYQDASFRLHGFRWDAGVVTTIDVPGAQSDVVWGINNRSQIVGAYADAEQMVHGFIATPIPKSPLTVTIDIKPGSDPAPINPKSQGKIPVAILTTDTFDATTVNAASVRFGATGIEAAPVQVAVEDVNGDGRPDLLLDFNTQDTGIQCGETSAFLTGKTFSGQAIQGSDSIVTVGCQ